MFIILSSFFWSQASAQTIVKTLNVQGYLRTSGGTAAAGTFGMRFTFKKNGAAFPTACQVTKNSVLVTSGVFNAAVDTSTCNLAGEISAGAAAAITVDIEVDFSNATFTSANSTYTGLPIYPVASALVAERANNIVLSGTSAQVLTHNGTNWVAGTVGTNGITNGAVTTAKLAAGAVDTNALGSGVITSAKLAAGAVTSAALGPGSISSSNMGAGSVESNAIAAGAITTAKLATGAVDSVALGAGSVTSAKLAAGSVDSAAIGVGVISGSHLGAGAVVSASISDNAVTGTKIANSAVDLTTKVTGTLPLANGGTGSTTGSITGTGALTFTTGSGTNLNLNPGTTGTVVVGGTTPTVNSAGNLLVKAANGSTTTIGDSSTVGSAVVVQAGSTGKIKVGSAGTVFQNMGVCTTSSITVTTTAANQTCTGIPASTSVAVTCTGAAAFTTPNTTTIYARPTGTGSQLAMNTTVANSVAMIYTCMWIQP